LLNIGEFGFINNISIKKISNNIFNLIKNIITTLFLLLKTFFIFLLKSKWGRYILLIFFLSIMYLIYDNIEVYTEFPEKLTFYEGFTKYIHIQVRNFTQIIIEIFK
jgi:hypothetical protein